MQSECAKRTLDASEATDVPALPGRLFLRLRGLAVLAPAVAVLWTAAMLHANPSGRGTHEQLGLAPCGFLARTGWPCPSCGLTTSVVATVHGQLTAAFGAQPFGPVFVLALAALGLAGLVEFVAGLDVLGRVRHWPWIIALTAGAMLLGWGLNAWIGWLHGRWPLQ